MADLLKAVPTDGAGPADHEALRIGWIGAGRMGAEMCRRLLASGCELSVYNRTRAKVVALGDMGASIVDSPAALADRDIVFTMVSGSDDLVEVACGASGLLTADSAPRILIDSSTVSAAASEDVRQRAQARGTQLLAAPVSGNPKVVAAGKATIASSGPWEAFLTARPYLETICRRVTYVGEGDAARLVKIAHNLVLGIMAEALAETSVLVEKGGVSRRSYLEFLNDSVLGSTFTRYKSPGIVTLDWTPTFTAELLRKDLDLGLDAAEALGATLPLVETTRQSVEAMIDDGLTEVDFQALLVCLAKAANLELVAEPGPMPDGLEADPALVGVQAPPTTTPQG